MKATSRDRIVLRLPTEEDGASMWELARDSKTLDLNSSYAYLLFAKYFSDTCLIAEEEGKAVGFVMGFHPPESPDTLFVWQIGVSESKRGQGIAKAMLRTMLQRTAKSDVRFLEATVSPSNGASRALFTKIANELATECEVTECFPARLFPGRTHEPEWTYRIGPVPTIS
ncbi:diaminobutyrate acetyltransferase [Brevibacillus brevis]|uniref:diaminobutyrate acetyltransferase n=1 Tax=Brevibacillus brevis TaxID=1393 RepID=UPI000E3A8070|nr:diaminobutyrate acetyltransferase [Brevibacillus brevis]RED35695.1 diaminobutyrate acetyltransferase [Brevibacillus brevis]GEC89238.1 L-2,4-diaminobutyric acid acetyltransferase [Brevibacillus brevis]VEF89194.1 L-2,4-diaminobutyric acid acetyltransferase [Brevibacillus brevis]